MADTYKQLLTHSKLLFDQPTLNFDINASKYLYAELSDIRNTVYCNTMGSPSVYDYIDRTRNSFMDLKGSLQLSVNYRKFSKSHIYPSRLSRRISPWVHCPAADTPLDPYYSVPLVVPDMNTQQNTPILTSSFGMQYLIEFQKRVYNSNQNLITYSELNITKESFEAILSTFPHKSLFEHNEKCSKVIEIIDDTHFIALKIDSSQITTYSVQFALLVKDKADILDSLVQAPIKRPGIKWIDGIDQYGELTHKMIKNFEITDKFYSSAYPFLNGREINQFVESYLTSNSPILLLYGPPGTGKSTLLKHILSLSNESALITFNKDIASMDALFSHFYDCPERFLIIEDADTYINSREKDGNDVMKKLLNITDGLTANKTKKVVFTTNLNNLTSVDPALTRKGRCYGAFNIGTLSNEQASQYLLDLGQESFIPQLSENNSLAEIHALINEEKDDTFTPSQVVAKFGFGS